MIRLEGPNAIRIRCRRDGERFRVDEVYGRTSRIEPKKTAAAQADVYANAILHAWGL